jgi:hypothetical protein
MQRLALICFVPLLFLAVPAFAQVDFSGQWSVRFYQDQEERSAGSELGDYTALPLNEAGRFRADSFDAAIYSLPEWQCRPNASTYMWRTAHPARITQEIDPVTGEIIALHVNFQDNLDRVVYLDGRPHPPEDAPHTWAGFSTGQWEGDSLTVTTTHLKEYIIRRNGPPTSDLATMVEHWFRHADFLTVVQIVTDPVYFTEPYIQSADFVLDLRNTRTPELCEIEEESDRPAGAVPHRTPEAADRDTAAFAKEHNMPVEAARGGAETMYPDFRKKLKVQP